MSADLFVDANVLLYSLFADSAWHAPAPARLAELEADDRRMAASQQVLREIGAVLTRGPPRGRGLSGVEAARLLRAISDRLVIVTESAASHAQWSDFVDRGLARGAQVHDANIVATMVANGIPTILTHNTRDFERFEGWIGVLPLDALPSPGR